MDLNFLPDSMELTSQTPGDCIPGDLSPGRKIDDDLLLQMLEAGKTQKECAEYFNCSGAAISKRLAKLNPAPVEPLKIDSLTDKEKRFVIEIVDGVSQTEAACRAYDVQSRASGKSLGCTLMKNSDIREAIDEICNREGLTREFLVKRLRQHVASKDPSASIRATELGLKLHGDLVEKKVNLNVNVDAVSPVDLSKYRNRIIPANREN